MERIEGAPVATFWNGLPTPARRGSAVVADAPEFPLYWARELVGQRIDVVEVVLDGVNYGGGIDYLDNREGQGWAKVTGGGGAAAGHASVAIEPGSFVAAEETGAELIAAERARQVAEEGYTAESDQGKAAELAAAGDAYARHAYMQLVYGSPMVDEGPLGWPWGMEYWKPSADPVRNLVKAAALLAAAIDAEVAARG